MTRSQGVKSELSSTRFSEDSVETSGLGETKDV